MKKIYAKNKFMIFAAMVCTAMVAACTQDKTDGLTELTPAGFTSGIATRAENGLWQADDRIGIFMVGTGQRLSDEAIAEGAGNMQYSAPAGASAALTAVSADDVIYFPMNGAVDFIAYHPYMQSSQIAGYAVTLDVSDQGQELAPDLLYSDNAKNHTKANPQVGLTFRHTMSRMAVNITLASEFEGIPVQSLRFTGFAAQGTFSLTSGEWTAGNAETIAPHNAGNGVFTAHMIPQGGAHGRSVVIDMGEKTYSYPIPETSSLLPNTAYTYDLTVGREGVMQIGVSIKSWSEAELEERKITFGDQLHIIWGGHNDGDFTAIELLGSNGVTYASMVAPNGDGTASATTGLIEADMGSITLQRVWVYYSGLKLELPDGSFDFSSGVLTIDGFNIIANRNNLEYINTSAETLADDYVQIRDIDMKGSADNPWTPTGNKEQPFTGTYDGSGYRIENLYVDLGTKTNGTSNFAGLFGFCLNSTLKDIHIASGTVAGYDYAGGVCGEFLADKNGAASISGCTNSATVNGNKRVGGICGYNNALSSSNLTMSGCSNSGPINGYKSVGGVSGDNDTKSSSSITVSGCANTGTVTGTYSVGGVSGYNYGGSIISGCTNSGSVTGNRYVGGVLGDGYVSMISGCANSGNVNGTQDVGGVCGDNYGSGSMISCCANSGDVNGEQQVGGVCGTNNSGTTISECFSASALTGDSHAGGVCGANNGKIEYCFWGIGKSDGTPPAMPVGNNVGGETCYEFGETSWPGNPAIDGYWILFSDGGKWKSLGEWHGSSGVSDYPVPAGLP